MFIFYLAEPIFFHGDVIRDIHKKGLHVFDASVDVTLMPFISSWLTENQLDLSKERLYSMTLSDSGGIFHFSIA